MSHFLELLFALVFAASPAFAQTSANPSQRIPAQRPIAGVVVDNQGQPVPGARLWWGGANDFIELTADQDGRFQAMSPIGWKLVEGPTGLGTIWAQADGYAPTSTSILGGDEQTRPELDLKVRLAPPRASAATQLRVVEQEGRPISDAVVELSPHNNTLPPWARSRISGRTDSDGLMNLTSPTLQAPRLRVTTSTHGTQDFQLLSWSGAPATRILRFCPTGRLEVRIGGDAESRRGLQISVHSNGPVGSQESSQEHLKLGASPFATDAIISELDSEGRFTIPAMIASKVNVGVTSPPDSPWLAEMPRQFDVVAGETTRIEIPMTRGIPVKGRVVDSVTNEPIPGVSVSVSSSRKTFTRCTATTDRDGRYTALALPGHVSVQVTSIPIADVGLYLLPPPIGGPAMELEPDANGKGFADFRLTAARRIIGRIRGKNMPVSGLRVYVDKLPQPGGFSDENGYFTMTLPIGLEPKTWTVGSPIGPKMEATVISTSPLILEVTLDQVQFGRRVP